MLHSPQCLSRCARKRFTELPECDSSVFSLSIGIVKGIIVPLFPHSAGALPARFRQQRILIVGCGDVALRLVRQRLPASQRGLRVMALTSSPERVPQLRSLGIVPIVANLDDPSSLRRLRGLATRLVHMAPPAKVDEPGMRVDALLPSPAQARQDTRTRALLAAVRKGPLPQALAYVSTTGVYGDCQGQWVHETRGVQPQNLRAWRRCDAEQQCTALAPLGVNVAVLRAPGIYAPDRPHGTPLARLQRQTPVLRAQDDVYTNRIHADDLARAAWLALWRVKGQRAFNVNDDTVMKMGDYFDWAAQWYGLPAPPRISRAQAEQTFSALQMSFLSESRRLVNDRVCRELRLQLRYPSPAQGLAAGKGEVI